MYYINSIDYNNRSKGGKIPDHVHISFFIFRGNTFFKLEDPLRGKGVCRGWDP